MERKKCLIIYNPMSGKGLSNKVLKAYKKVLHTNNYSVDVIATKYSNHASEAIANACNYDIVFVVGGDGTLNEVVRGNHLRSEQLPVCPLPNGTCNDVAKMLGFNGKNPITNLTMGLNGKTCNMDIGEFNGTQFSYVAGLGRFMSVCYETSSEEKRKYGYIAYLKKAIAELLSNDCYRAEVTIDGVKMEGAYSLIMVSNSNHIAGINGFHKDVCLNDGKLEVLLCKHGSNIDFFRNFLMYFMGIKTDAIISTKASEIRLKLLDTPRGKLCVDGEGFEYDGEELVFKVTDSMPVKVPEGKTLSLFKPTSKQVI